MYTSRYHCSPLAKKEIDFDFYATTKTEHRRIHIQGIQGGENVCIHAGIVKI